MAIHRPEWFPKRKSEYLVWIGIGIALRVSPLPGDVAFAAAVALYVLRVFLWPSVREIKEREKREESDSSDELDTKT